jgi:hypothetical protein
MAMNDARHEMRIKSSEACELDLDGSIHECRIQNRSTAGALVTCLGFLREAWPGDKGVVHLHDKGSRTCHIVHIAAAKIGVHFDD